MSNDRVQREVEVMTTPRETQIQVELDGNGKSLHKQAQAVEERWRTAHGFDDKLRGKRQQKAKRAKRQRLERGEVRRREERKRQRIEREALRLPLLKGVRPVSS